MSEIKYLSLVLFFVIAAYDKSSGQQSIQNPGLTLNLKNQSLEKTLNLISEKTGIGFSYSERQIPLAKKINLHVENASVSEVFSLIGNQTGVNFSEVRGQWVITKSPPRTHVSNTVKTENDTASEILKDKENNEIYTISGIIKDKDNGETLIGTGIYINDLAIGSMSNAYGFYSITVPEGNHEIQFSFVGYEQVKVQLDLATDITRNIYLSKSSTLMQEVIVKPDENLDKINLPQMSMEVMKPAEVVKIPALMGESDIIKSLLLLPGVKFQSDGSAYFYIRGGDRDQNLILIDEAPVYNPSHMLGIFTSFIPDAIKDIKIYKGDLPSSEGGRLSSLIDIKTNDGNMNRFAVNGSLGLISEKLTLEGPVVKGKSSFFISGRRSHLQWFMKKLNPGIKDFYFSDLNAKMNFRINANNRLFLSLYNGADNYDQSNSGINWKNIASTIRWNHIFNDKLFSNTTLYGSRYDYFLKTSLSENSFWTSQIANISLRSDYSWFINPSNTFLFGINLSGHNFNPGNFYIDGKLTGNLPYVSQKHAREIVLYGENEQMLGDKWFLRYGLRFSRWQNTGEAIEYSFDSNHDVFDSTYYSPGRSYHSNSNLEPRLGMRYKISNSSSFKASYTHTVQYMQVISNSISPFTSLDVWLPAGPNIKPQNADQFSGGYFRDLPIIKSVFSIEGYYKIMRNQIDYSDHAKMLLNPLIESELRFGKTKAYGLEVLLKHNSPRLEGWLSYNWSNVKKTTPEINKGEAYPAIYDRPHEMTFFANYKPGSRTQLSANWILASGSPFTTPSGYYQYNGSTVPIFTGKNNDRLPPYHRLDITALFRLNKKVHRFSHSIGINIFNVYGRENPVFINFNKIVDNNGKIVVPSDTYGIQDIKITKTYIYNVIPSITYNFSVE